MEWFLLACSTPSLALHYCHYGHLTLALNLEGRPWAQWRSLKEISGGAKLLKKPKCKSIRIQQVRYCKYLETFTIILIFSIVAYKRIFSIYITYSITKGTIPKYHLTMEHSVHYSNTALQISFPFLCTLKVHKNIFITVLLRDFTLYFY